MWIWRERNNVRIKRKLKDSSKNMKRNKVMANVLVVSLQNHFPISRFISSHFRFEFISISCPRFFLHCKQTNKKFIYFQFAPMFLPFHSVSFVFFRCLARLYVVYVTLRVKNPKTIPFTFCLWAIFSVIFISNSFQFLMRSLCVCVVFGEAKIVGPLGTMHNR